VQVDLAVELLTRDFKLFLQSLATRVPALRVAAPARRQAAAEVRHQLRRQKRAVSEGERAAAVQFVPHVCLPLLLAKGLATLVSLPLEIQSIERAFLIGESLVAVKERHQYAVDCDHLRGKLR